MMLEPQAAKQARLVDQLGAGRQRRTSCSKQCILSTGNTSFISAANMNKVPGDLPRTCVSILGSRFFPLRPLVCPERAGRCYERRPIATAIAGVIVCPSLIDTLSEYHCIVCTSILEEIPCRGVYTCSPGLAGSPHPGSWCRWTARSATGAHMCPVMRMLACSTAAAVRTVHANK